VDEPLVIYRTQIGELEPCSDQWFGTALAAAQTGDDDARRRIVGSCLSVALRIAERHYGHLDSDELLGFIECANHGLWQSVPTFRGTTADEFVRHAEQSVEAHLKGAAS
jgi:hypothetical protein